MSPTSTLKLVREFAFCVVLSFAVVIGVIHTALHLLQNYCVSQWLLQSRVAEVLTEPAVRIAQITQAREYLLVVLKVTVACTILVFAAREVGQGLASWMGSAAGGETSGDLEAGDTKVAGEWKSDEKRPYMLTVPAPQEALVAM